VKLRHLAVGTAALMVALAGLSACGSDDDAPSAEAAGGSQKSGTLRVWLQVDAQNSWADQVSAATTAFNKKHPKVKVKVDYQQWPDHLTKLDAALAGSDAPDVVEFGNTETTKYMAAGALADISGLKGDFENSDTWLQTLEDSCTYDGKLYCVPYYAGSRGIIARQDMFKQAGINKAPETREEFEAALDKLQKKFGSDPNFSAFYIPGKYWYFAMSLVEDEGGTIAVKDGDQWKGALDSPEAIAGLKQFKEWVTEYSTASKTADESKQPNEFANSKSAMEYGNGWEWGVITGPDGNPKLDGKIMAFPLPGASGDGPVPTFLGGSDLAITAKSKQQDLAADWIAAFTSNQNMTDLATVAKVLPNTTSLSDLNADDPKVAPFAAASVNSWFVPTAENWASVEKANILQEMCQNIVTGKQSVEEAAADASQRITETLNGA
jgi:N,N'-diacetylchitobiose transport system substrate-binding protein